MSLVANGSLALDCAIRCADLTGEVITTPYSFVATAHSIQLAGLTPVFADIRRHDFNLDPARVEAAITEQTSAILAVHCYGSPCDHDALAAIATRHNLKLIYDAAHCFGVTLGGTPIVSWGDFATLSFHATKAFNTLEGGAVVCAHPAGKEAVDLFRNFGIASEESIPGVGTNAKMNEISAAIGLLQLDRFEQARAARGAVAARYRDELAGIAGIEVPEHDPRLNSNYSYFPIFVTADYGNCRDGLHNAMKRANIYTRRYFYPHIASLPAYRDLPSARAANVPIAVTAAAEVLCLPIYEGLQDGDIDRVIAIIRG